MRAVADAEPAVQMAAAGDRLPGCFGMTADRSFYSSEEQYGRPAVMLLLGAEAACKATGLVNAMADAADRFAEAGAALLLVVDDNPNALWNGRPAAIPTIDGGDFLLRCGVGPNDIAVLVVDRSLRVAASFVPNDPERLVEACVTSLRCLPQEAGCAVNTPAPVMVLPNLLSAEFCRRLVERFDVSPTMDGEVARVDAAGRVCSVIDHHKKRRRDMAIAPDDALYSTVRNALVNRCAPEIAKAFQVHVAHLDRILIARYDDSGGWFRRHRDNAAPHIAFRQFALSVNLNSGEYDGGHLLFPEFNDHRYAPPTGGGLVFSSSLLHEAAPVTRGARYVLLTFLHSEAAEVRRQSYLTQNLSR